MVVRHKNSHPHREADSDQANWANDPVLAMLGVGRQLWELESGDNFVERLRSENLPAPPAAHPSPEPAVGLADTVWQRVVSHQGEQFRATVGGFSLTFEVDGAGIWFFRDGKRVNRKSTRTQFEVALSRCPLASTTQIKDLMDYPYLFAVLTADEYGARNGDRMARVFWDTNLFIYLFERNEEWSPRVIELRRKMLARGDELLTSYLTVGEAITKPKQLKNSMLERSYLNFFSGGSVELVGLAWRPPSGMVTFEAANANWARRRHPVGLRFRGENRPVRDQRQPALGNGCFRRYVRYRHRARSILKGRASLPIAWRRSQGMERTGLNERQMPVTRAAHGLQRNGPVEARQAPVIAHRQTEQINVGDLLMPPHLCEIE